jgi:DtxR family transcriptional regulator, Mn-dependent transcriptional regulator
MSKKELANWYAGENYLKVIYKLSLSGDTRISTKSIAEKISTKPSSVTDMIKKLADRKLINYNKYKGVILTRKGEMIAVNLIRKHRLWEEFLSVYLGFNWDEVHDLAEELEHIKSDLLTDKLDKLLNYPKSDPHGDPIPDRRGIFPYPESIKLSELEESGRGVVVGLVSRETSFLEYLNQLAVHNGTEIEILNRNRFDLTAMVLIDGKMNSQLSQKVSENILIRKK